MRRRSGSLLRGLRVSEEVEEGQKGVQIRVSAAYLSSILADMGSQGADTRILGVILGVSWRQGADTVSSLVSYAYPTYPVGYTGIHLYRECIRSVSRRMYASYVSHTHLGTDLEVEVQIHKEYMWIHDDTPRYTEYIQNTEKIRILDTIHDKYIRIRIEGKRHLL